MNPFHEQSLVHQASIAASLVTIATQLSALNERQALGPVLATVVDGAKTSGKKRGRKPKVVVDESTDAAATSDEDAKPIKAPRVKKQKTVEQTVVDADGNPVTTIAAPKKLGRPKKEKKAAEVAKEASEEDDAAKAAAKAAAEAATAAADAAAAAAMTDVAPLAAVPSTELPTTLAVPVVVVQTSSSPNKKAAGRKKKDKALAAAADTESATE